MQERGLRVLLRSLLVAHAQGVEGAGQLAANLYSQFLEFLDEINLPSPGNDQLGLSEEERNFLASFQLPPEVSNQAKNS